MCDECFASFPLFFTKKKNKNKNWNIEIVQNVCHYVTLVTHSNSKVVDNSDTNTISNRKIV